MKSQLAAKLLDLAGHPDTPEPEALSALKKARQHVGSFGEVLSKVSGSGSDARSAEDVTRILDLTHQNATLRVDLLNLQHAHKRDVRDLTQRLEEAERKYRNTRASRLEKRVEELTAEVTILRSKLRYAADETGVQRAQDARLALAKERGQSIMSIIETMADDIRSSPKKIATELNRREVRTPRGGTWEGSQVTALMKRMKG